MKSYPKWLYHSSKPATVVADEAAHKALGPGWEESPSAFKSKSVSKAEEKPETAAKPVLEQKLAELESAKASAAAEAENPEPAPAEKPKAKPAKKASAKRVS